MKEKLKKLWENHKLKILIVAALIAVAIISHQIMLNI